MDDQPVLKTPDPLITQEQAAAFVAAFLTNLIVLFKLDVSDGQQAAIIGMVNTAYAIFVLIHAAWTRYGRSRALLYPPKAQVDSNVIPAELLTAPTDGDDRVVATKKRGASGA